MPIKNQNEINSDTCTVSTFWNLDISAYLKWNANQMHIVSRSNLNAWT